MERTRAFEGLACLDCGEHVPAEPATDGCPVCGGPIGCQYDFEGVTVTRERLERPRFDGIARYDPVLPFPSDRLVTLAEGTTPLVACPSLAEALGVGSVYVKDEGRNPTGSIRDRAFAVAVTRATEREATAIALPTTGDGGQSAAAYAARAGLDVEAFVPSRSTFVAKAMTNVHGGEMSVVEGRYGDAVAAFESALSETSDATGTGTVSLAPGTPYRHEGLKTLLYEVLEQCDWTVPDGIVYPTAHGESVVGSAAAVAELDDLGIARDVPELHVAQPSDCAPLVEAWETGAPAHDPWEYPDTLVGALEVPDPVLGEQALDAVRDTGGRAVAVPDEAALEAAVELAAEGVEASATGGVGAATARHLAEQGRFGPDDTVVLINPVAGNKESDVLRSHLMRASG